MSTIPPKIRYAQVGVGGRSLMFSEAIVETYAETSELVALCDVNPGRLKLRAEWAAERGVAVKTYGADEFDKMVTENFSKLHLELGIDSLHEIIDHRESVKHLRF